MHSRFKTLLFLFLIVLGSSSFFFIAPKPVYAVDCTGTAPDGSPIPAGCTMPTSTPAEPKSTPADAGKAPEVKAAEKAAAAPAAAPAKDSSADTGGMSLADKILLYLAGLGISFAGVLSKLVILELQMLMPIMLYNDFSNNPVVDSGWAILRDTVNMFFVVILIAIAFGTIFGEKRFNWQQQMPRLLIFAIVINFSRILCGLMIDFGQVIMLTFANAIREIAAGNFVAMLGMGDIYSMSPPSDPSQGARPFDYFASAVAAIVMMFAVLVIMLMMLLLFLYRVVMLWILITVSPLAWFVGGAQDLLKSKAYAEWWEQFKCLIIIGPILTFFLWLTLVVGGSGGGGGMTSGFELTSGTAGGFISTFFEMPKLISFIVALGLLWSGFDSAQRACVSMPGIGNPADFVKGGAMKLAKGTVGVGAKVGAYGARVAGRTIKKGGSSVYRATGLEDKFSKRREAAYRDKASRAGSEEAKMKYLEKAEAEAAKRASLVDQAGDKYKGKSNDSVAAVAKDKVKNKNPGVQDRLEQEAIYKRAMQDPKLAAKLQADGTLAALEQNVGKSLRSRAGGDPALKSAIEAFDKQNAHIGGNYDNIKTSGDVAGMTEYALSDPKAKDRLSKIDSKTKRSKADLAAARKTDPNASEYYSMADLAARGDLFGKDDIRTKAFNEGRGAIYENMKPAELAALRPEVLAANLTAGMLNKQVGENGPTVQQQLLSSTDPAAQAALHRQLNARDAQGKLQNPALREALLGGENGVNKNQEAFVKALTTNPAILSYLDQDTFNNMMENSIDSDVLRSTFADPIVLQKAIKGIKADSGTGAVSGDMKSRISTILAGREDQTADITDASFAFNSQMRSMEESKARMDALKAAPAQVKEAVKTKMEERATAQAERTQMQTEAAQGNIDDEIANLQQQQAGFEEIIGGEGYDDKQVKRALAGALRADEQMKVLNQRRDAAVAAATAAAEAVANKAAKKGGSPTSGAGTT